MRRILEISVWSVWGIVFYFTLRSHNAEDYHLAHEVKKNISFLLPQGWGFFTKDPKEAIIMAYKIENGELDELTVQNSSVINYLGFSRDSRYAGMELSGILEHISNGTWKSGIGDFKNKIPSKADTTITLKEKLRFFPEGEYVLHQYKPIPFAWAGKDQEKYQPYMIAKIKILYKE